MRVKLKIALGQKWNGYYAKDRPLVQERIASGFCEMLKPAVRKPLVISYLAIFLTLLLVGWLHLTTPFIAVLFSYLVLGKLCFLKRKWVAVILFLLLMAAIFCGFVYFLKNASKALPKVVSDAVPLVVQYAEHHGIDLPFTDMESLKELAVSSVKDTLGYLVNFARIATKEFVLLAVGLVIAIGVFLNPKLDHERDQHRLKENLYTFYTGLIAERFRAFYRSFERVMGAQLIISAINTVLTAIFVYAGSLRYASVVIILTFLCGLLPIVGNLVSNAIIVGIAFTYGSPRLAIVALVFLVVIHKLEYFLNSKIVGSLIRHPMWLTLVALVLGERLMGIPGIILAPVILNFVKVEAIQVEVGAKK